MKGRFVYISGSAGRSCPVDKLDVAVRFITSFTGEVLRRGGGVVVLAGDEQGTRVEHGAARIFDWVALEEVERYANSTTEPSRIYARVIMSDDAPEFKIDDDHLRLLRNLEQRDVVELRHIRREVFTGGEYRRVMTETADAMLAIGGGKGTYSAGVEMIAQGKPVLPLDLRLGSSADDGEGAVALHREMLQNSGRFIPDTHTDTINRVGLISLDRGINDPATVAQAVVEMLIRETKAVPLPEQRTNGKSRLASTWQVAKALPVAASAIKVFDWVRSFLTFTL